MLQKAEETVGTPTRGTHVTRFRLAVLIGRPRSLFPGATDLPSVDHSELSFYYFL